MLQLNPVANMNFPTHRNIDLIHNFCLCCTITCRCSASVLLSSRRHEFCLSFFAFFDVLWPLGLLSPHLQLWGLFNGISLARRRHCDHGAAASEFGHNGAMLCEFSAKVGCWLGRACFAFSQGRCGKSCWNVEGCFRQRCLGRRVVQICFCRDWDFQKEI